VLRLRLLLEAKFRLFEKRTPPQPWSELTLPGLLRPDVPHTPELYWAWRKQNPRAFFFQSFSLERAHCFIGPNCTRDADLILNGEFPFFGRTRALGYPPGWDRDPLSGNQWPAIHWSLIDEFSAGDVKLTWEASRFGWAYTLTRAYVRSRDERYPQAFWQLFEDWMEHHPPNLGIHWKCGQEVASRAMAICFAAYAFADSPATNARRVAQMVAALAVHARRIEAHTAYARSQKNNHGLSEGVGLWTIGLLFPELREARVWRAHGKRIIEAETRRQVYADGSYVQHSMNYHRVLLQLLAWAIRLGDRSDDPLDKDCRDALRRSVAFFDALVDKQSGHTPNCGANDGALVLPLSDCSFPDMRPAVQNAARVAEMQRPLAAGPWDEEMVWLNGIEALSAEATRPVASCADLNATQGGFYTMHGTDSWIMLRAAQFEDRPSHADQLHVDLWWRGENILCDAGTYSYNPDRDFLTSFSSTRHHNTVLIDGLDQMTRLIRFLWADWADARTRRYGGGAKSPCVLEGEHTGYRKVGVLHRRAVMHLGTDRWVIVDDLTGSGRHRARLHWLMAQGTITRASPQTMDCSFRAGPVRLFIASSMPSQIDCVRGGERVFGDSDLKPEPTRGWISRCYAHKEPAMSLSAQTDSTLPLRFMTVVALGGSPEIVVDNCLNHLRIDDHCISLAPIGRSPIFPRGEQSN
jgi:asparagine synthase (glutamine-hydrolysing)